MTDTEHDTMRVLVYREGDFWLAQCIERDISAQACDFDSVMRRIVATVNAECDYSRKKGVAEFEGIDPAPQYFHDRFNAIEQTLRADNMELRIAA